MNLEMVSGCICDSLTVDGKEEVDMNDKEREDIISHIMKNLKIPESKYYDFLEWCLQELGDFTYSGDYSSKNWKDIYTITI